MNRSIFAEFTSQAIFRLEENLEKVLVCLDNLAEEELWDRPNKSSNSVGNQLLHLCGNMTQYVISSLGHVEDLRDRDGEFAARGGYTKAALVEMLSQTTADVAAIIHTFPAEEALTLRSVQGYDSTAINIILHVVEHFSYHTGQIIFWVKQRKDKGFNFYHGHNLNTKNVIG